MDIWSACSSAIVVSDLHDTLIRLVESQEQVATNSLVDNLHEQEILEHLIERTKPPLKPAPNNLHYLLATPFRYPPLLHGSRFGKHTEPSLLYGSKTLSTLFAEAAYYRFVFWKGMQTPPPSGKLTTQHCYFAVPYQTQRGLRLQNKPFLQYQNELTDPAHYATTQQLGSAMREQGIEAFEFTSARDPQRGINVALFTPVALADTEPLYQQSCLCETRDDHVSFYSNQPFLSYQFTVTQFLHNGTLPQPAP